ncbi:MAG: zeta toxin family protein [Bradymonadales bacterium]|nr:zeta toxin family protein [Bradymonadales bacterium]
MIFVDHKGYEYPFSKGILARSIAVTGLSIERIYELVISIYSQLEEAGRASITTDEIQELVCNKLIASGYQKESRFYKVTQKMKHLEKPILILIGGAPGVGKSSISAEIGQRLGINMVISSDTVREIMRSMVSRDLIPTLHESTFVVDERLRSPFAINQLINAFDQQVSMVCEGLGAVVARCIKEGIDMVLNGVHIVPGYMELEVAKQEAFVFVYVLAVTDVDEHIRRFYERSEGSRRDPDRYISRIGKIRKLQDYILQRATQENATIITDQVFDQCVETVVKDVITTLEKEVLG